MNTKVALLLLFVACTFAQTCNTLDVGTYACSINHPGHSVHAATVVIGTSSSFSYNSTSESCVTSGSYAITNETLTFSSASNNLGCIVDSSSTDSVVFTSCIFNSGCNSFSCVSNSNSEGSTDLDCDLNGNNFSAAVPMATSLALLAFLFFVLN